MNFVDTWNRIRHSCLSVTLALPRQGLAIRSAGHNVTARTPVAGRYTGVAIAIHWLAALLIIGALVIGVSMVDMPVSPSRLKLYSYHKWIGITILALSAVRLGWRLTHRPPPDLDTVVWRRAAAHLTHAALYVLFFAVPLVGWALTSALGFSVVLFGSIPLPDFVPVDKALGELLKPWHRGLALALGSLVAVHVLAAISHRFIDGHSVLRRMGVKFR